MEEHPDKEQVVVTPHDEPQQQICTINVVAVVDNDEQALAVKRAITKATEGMEKRRIQFTIMDVKGEVMRSPMGTPPRTQA